jgi:endonuclease V-like protein UPF0215 family
MRLPDRPHLLGIDDGPFDKHRDADVPLVGVLMEGPDLVEAVATARFPVDGEDVTGFLAAWVESLRFRPALQGVVLGGVTLAGLAVVDVAALSERLAVPVLVVNRREPRDAPLLGALEAAGLAERGALLARLPPPRPVGERLWVAASGIDADEAGRLVERTRRKSELPEALRVAHLVAAALARCESRGRP